MTDNSQTAVRDRGRPCRIPPPLLAAEGLSKRYGAVQALLDVSLSLARR